MKIDERRLIASLARDSFYDFVREFWEVIIAETPVFNWHVKVICDEMQTVAERIFAGRPREYDLVINVPPGSTKSTICSQMFPAWCWTRMPSMKFINASYAYPIALKDSLRTRDIVESDLYQSCFNIHLREDENTKGLFVNTETGFRYSAGVGGAVTGYHGHVLMVDDPINPEESFSESELKIANRWMEITLPPRRIDKAISTIILIQQRLHQGDPSGEMLARNRSGGVRHICIPGELTDRVSPPELKQYYKDGLMDPVRLPRKALEQLRTDLGEYGYASQILQDPVPLGGGLFKTERIQRVREAPDKIVKVVRSWDKAGTQGGGAYSAGALLGVTKKGFFVIMGMTRGQWGAHEREKRIRATADLDGYDVEVVLELEGGSGGKDSGEETARNLSGYKIYTYHPTGDKESRAYALASQVGAGNVYMLEGDWNDALIEELKYFPHSKYKDQVDALSGAFKRLARPRIKIGGMRNMLSAGY